ncbi:YqhR family membrane protein [Brevibacillus daliensis]|uniref:YqhR family membrane protein n=1 Tax=Brevibacillus daliensis TaxID=2892995 RepID=UPI001E60E15B|nr:YqhR family membrane protein [Brevibacillus daliensis]
METTKSNKETDQQTQTDSEHKSENKQESTSNSGRMGKQIVTLALWGAILWGILRLVFSTFQFTPYKLYVFSRPILGKVHENSYPGLFLGILVLFILILAAAVLYYVFLSRIYIWWLGILYGIGFFYLYGYFFQMWRWGWGTWSTEFFWFVSLGMFLGMSIIADRNNRDEETGSEGGTAKFG